MIIDWNRCEEHRVIQKDHKKKKRNFMSCIYNAYDPGCGTIRH